MKKIILFLTTIVLTFFVQSCGTTKNKVTSNSKEKTEINTKTEEEKNTKISTEETKEEKKEAVNTVDSSATDVKKTTIIEENTNVTIKGDGSGEIGIEEKQTPTGKKTIISGASEVTLNNSKKETFKIDSLNVIVKRKDSINESLLSKKKKDSLSFAKILSELNSKHQKKIRETETQIKRNSFWMWVSFGLLAFILIQNRKRLGSPV